MTGRAPPAWLGEFQASFGAMVRTPLDRATGTLRATPEAYPATLEAAALPGRKLSSVERLAVYNRQYWFRLFTVFQAAFPLTTRLLSHFTFNGYVSRFLLAHPPRSWDIDAAVHGFEDFLDEVAPSPTVSIDGQRAGVDRAALLQAARIDAAFHHVLRASQVDAFKPTAEHAERLLTSRLLRSPAAAVLEEAWPLCELRRTLATDTRETAVALPARLAQPQFWLLLRTPAKMGQLPLEPLEARLLTLLQELPVGEALAQLEQACDASRLPQLPADAQRWLARSVENGFWCGLTDEAAPHTKHQRPPG
ncbi:MAG TPA: putative DNA-binding domain-containing protein [Polyangiaceae bacterium]|nr:putative DNA-binding domain-containing protein [Polyangiaceae bacterium]